MYRSYGSVTSDMLLEFLVPMALTSVTWEHEYNLKDLLERLNDISEALKEILNECSLLCQQGQYPLQEG
jgi:hypothetical protein